MYITQDEFENQVVEVLKSRNDKAAENDALARDVVNEVADRISLYLQLQPNDDNNYMFDERLIKVAARIASGVFTRTAEDKSGTGGDLQIASISDNGQSVSYADNVRSYLSTADDEEVFGGFAKLLKPFRRCRVVA